MKIITANIPDTDIVSVPFRGYVVVIPVPATRWGNYVPAAICGANRRRSILDVTVNSNHDVF